MPRIQPEANCQPINNRCRIFPSGVPNNNREWLGSVIRNTGVGGGNNFTDRGRIPSPDKDLPASCLACLNKFYSEMMAEEKKSGIPRNQKQADRRRGKRVREKRGANRRGRH